MTLTAGQQDLVDAIASVLRTDPDIEAAWLAGSLGQGLGDAFSDVDVLALVAQKSAVEVGLQYARDVRAIAEPALVNALFGGQVVNVVTMDWRRFDISFVRAGDLERYDASRLTLLFNHGTSSPRRTAAVAYKPSPEALLKLINEFLRVLGLGVVGVGRQEWLVMLAGQDILRRLTIDLMVESNGIGPGERGGALHVNRLLTREQRVQLESLPPLAANRESLVAATAAIAAIFLPKARALAAETGTPWPAALETATRRYLRGGIGLLI